MAFSGLHVTFGYAGGFAVRSGAIPIYGPMTSSDDPASGVVSTKSAPPYIDNHDPMASVYSAVDAWLTVGANPADPSNPSSTRRPIPAATPVDFFCAAGDKICWVAA